MGSSSGQTPTTSTQTNDPWSGAQPHLQDLYSRAGDLTGQVQGYEPYPGNLQAGLDPVLGIGVGAEKDLGAYNLYGTQGVNTARGLGTSLLGSGGLNADQRGVAGKFSDIYNQASGQENPYLQAMLDTSNRRIADKVNSSVSGAGRYGSGAHTDVLGRSLAEAADPILAQDYARRMQERMGAATSLAGLYQQGQDTAGRWAQLMPALDEAVYAGAGHVQNAGQFNQNRAAQDLANQVAVWNAQQGKQWENLQRYAGILSGAGGLGGTKVTTTTPAQASTLQRMFGGGLAGAGLGGSIFGAPGAAAGGLGGGLLGMM